jgi:hypothetical protein
LCVGFTAIQGTKEENEHARPSFVRFLVSFASVRSVVRESRSAATRGVSSLWIWFFSTKKHQISGRHTADDDGCDDGDDATGVERRGMRRDVCDAGIAPGAAMRVAAVEARFFAWEPKRRDWWC